MADPTVAIHVPDLSGGGAERMMVNLANEFASRGLRTDLVVTHFKGTYCDEVDNAVSVVELDPDPVPLYAAMGALRPLRRYLLETRPDAMLSALTRANVVALLAHRLADVPTRIVVSERNHLSSTVGNAEMRRMRALPPLVRLTYPWADRVIPISDGVGKDLADTASIADSSMRTIYNPVVTPSLFELAEEPPAHPWFDGDTAYDVLLGVGSLTRQKDFPTLLRCFAELAERRDVRLVILGEGPKRGDLDGLATELGVSDIVDMPGFVDNPFAYMKRADVFVLSSEWEGFGNVLVEAMACGTPVVSTDCPSGPSEILDGGEYGPLVPVGDPHALADAVSRTLGTPPSPTRLEKRAREFSVSTIAEQYLDVLLPQRTHRTG